MSDVDLYDSSGNYVGTAQSNDDAWMGPVILLGLAVMAIIAIIYIIAILLAIAAVAAAIYGLVRVGIWATPRLVFLYRKWRGWKKLEKLTATLSDVTPSLDRATMETVTKKLGPPDSIIENNGSAEVVYKARLINPETKLHDDLRICFVNGVVESVSDVVTGQSVTPSASTPIMPKFSLKLTGWKSTERKRKDAWIAWKKGEATLEQMVPILKGADSNYVDQFIGKPDEFIELQDDAYKTANGVVGTHTAKFAGKVRSRKTGQTGDFFITFANGRVIGVGDDSGQSDLFMA